MLLQAFYLRCRRFLFDNFPSSIFPRSVRAGNHLNCLSLYACEWRLLLIFHQVLQVLARLRRLQ